MMASQSYQLSTGFSMVLILCALLVSMVVLVAGIKAFLTLLSFAQKTWAYMTSPKASRTEGAGIKTASSRPIPADLLKEE